MTISDNIKERAIGLLMSYQKDLTLSGHSGSPSDSSPPQVTLASISGGNGSFPSPTTTHIDARYGLSELDVRSVDMTELIRWLNSRVTDHGIGLTTAKCYRRWLASFFESVNHPGANVIRSWFPPGSVEEVLVSDELDARRLAETETYGKVELTNKNNRYLAFMDGGSLSLLIEQLLSANRNGTPRFTSGPSAALLFTTTMMTGLRPNEWPTARYMDTFFDPETSLTLGPVLEIHSAKQNSRREDNPLRAKRYLVLDKWPEHQLQRLKALLSEVELNAEDFDAYYNKARMTLSRAWKRILRERPRMADSVDTQTGTEDGDTAAGVSIYTARHIFAEETRRGNACTRFEMAAMLGHSMLTNQVYYGPRTHGSEREFDFVLPRPWPGDADDIMEWDQKVNPRRHKYMQSDLFGGAGQGNDSSDADKNEDRDGVSSFFLR